MIWMNNNYKTNSPKCQELRWACTSLAVETYGNWGVYVRIINTGVYRLLKINK